MKECISILSREFWLNGELVTPCCCVFFRFSDGSWNKALYNDEQCIWEYSDSDEIPDEESPLGDEEFYYPYKQYLPSEKGSVGELDDCKLIKRNRLEISFSSGFGLTLSYNPETETEHIEVNT